MATFGVIHGGTPADFFTRAGGLATLGRLEQSDPEGCQSTVLFPSRGVVDGETNFPGKGNGLRRSRPRTNRQSSRLRAMPGSTGGEKFFPAQRDAGAGGGEPCGADLA